LLVFVITWSLADKHEFAVGVAGTEDDVR
jgi:hypothetical protein